MFQVIYHNLELLVLINVFFFNNCYLEFGNFQAQAENLSGNMGAIPVERDAAATNMFEGKISYRKI